MKNTSAVLIVSLLFVLQKFLRNFKTGNEKINPKRTQPKIKKRGLKLLRKIPKLGFHTG